MDLSGGFFMRHGMATEAASKLNRFVMAPAPRPTYSFRETVYLFANTSFFCLIVLFSKFRHDRSQCIVGVIFLFWHKLQAYPQFSDLLIFKAFRHLFSSTARRIQF
jgi:hypothetical protein